VTQRGQNVTTFIISQFLPSYHKILDRSDPTIRRHVCKSSLIASPVHSWLSIGNLCGEEFCQTLVTAPGTPSKGKGKNVQMHRFVSTWWCALSPTRPWLWTLDCFEPSRSIDRLGLTNAQCCTIRKGHPKTVSEHRQAAIVRAAGHPTGEG